MSTLTLKTLLQATMSYTTVQDRGLLQQAFAFANSAHKGTFRSTGEAYIQHPLAVALILANMQMPPDALVAAMLHDVVEDTSTTIEDIQTMFGETIRQIVDGLTKFNNPTGQITKFTRIAQRQQSVQKILRATITQPLVIIIKLADRLHNMRTLQALSMEKRKYIARETLEIYAPLAERLGIRLLADELYNLSIYYCNHSYYIKVQEQLTRLKRPVKEIQQTLQTMLSRYTLDIEVKAITKNFSNLYTYRHVSQKKDLLAQQFIFYIYVESIEDCYRALGRIHTLYMPDSGAFHDCIATPERNGYQALQTIIYWKNIQPITIHIQTHEMRDKSSYGIAKGFQKIKTPTRDEEQFWIEQVRSWEEELPLQYATFVSKLKHKLLQEQIFVFTATGEIIDLPKGASVLDFAYAIHTDIGDTCAYGLITYTYPITGKLIKEIKPHYCPLTDGDIVEIVSDKQVHPNSSWLRCALTPHAKNNIRKYLIAHNTLSRTSLRSQRRTNSIPMKKFQCHILASDRPGLLWEISSSFTQSHISLNYAKLETKTEKGRALFTLHFTIGNKPDTNKVIKQLILQLQEIPDIIYIYTIVPSKKSDRKN
jgi:GTP pyrophosphokinase